MLKCSEIALLGSDYVDKNLDWKQALAFRLHLLICNNCRRFISHLKITLTFLRNMTFQRMVGMVNTRNIFDRIDNIKSGG